MQCAVTLQPGGASFDVFFSFSGVARRCSKLH